MSSFIKAIALLLEDRQELMLESKKIKDDLIITIIPGPTTRLARRQITIPKEDLERENLDSELLGYIGKPTQEAAKEIKVTDLPATKDSVKAATTPAKAKKPAPKKAVKKAPAKKAPVKKKAAVKKAVPNKPIKKAPISKTNESVSENADNVQKPEESVTIPEASQSLPGASGSNEAPQPDPNIIFDKCMQHAAKQFASKNYSDAEDEYLKALQIKPESTEAKAGAERARKWAAQLAKISS